MKVAIRTDSSLSIGTGHLVRCLTLAAELRRRGAEVSFVCRNLPGNLASQAGDAGFEMHLLPAPSPHASFFTSEADSVHAKWLGVPWQQDARETFSTLKGLSSGRFDWLVLDHYGIDRRWELALRSLADKILVIDDLADRRHDCDLLVDQNLLSDDGIAYERLVPYACCKLLGPKYALLRPEFQTARQECSTRNGSVKRVLIFFGGIDATNETSKCLRALNDLEMTDVEVDVVVGTNNPHIEEIRALCDSRAMCILHCQTSRMANLMAEADLAIGAGGVATWERCVVGLPALAWPVAENQRRGLAAVSAQGAVLMPGCHKRCTQEQLSRYLFVLMQAPELLRHMGKCASQICDGAGARRIADALSPTTVRVRPAAEEDCWPVYVWRADPKTVSASLAAETFSYDSHREWFLSSLESPNRHLLVGEINGEPIGFLRYDIIDETAEASIFLVPGQDGRGYGYSLLRAGEIWLMQQSPFVQRLVARVLPWNAPSLRIFEKDGFKAKQIVYEKLLSS